MNKSASEVFDDALDAETKDLKKAIELYKEAERLYTTEGCLVEARACSRYAQILEREIALEQILFS